MSFREEMFLSRAPPHIVIIRLGSGLYFSMVGHAVQFIFQKIKLVLILTLSLGVQEGKNKRRSL